MKCYALQKTDGTVSVMQVFDPKASPDTELPRFRPEERAMFTGAWQEIDRAEWEAALSTRPQHKDALTYKNGRFGFDSTKAAAIDAAKPKKSIEQRLADLEGRLSK